METTETKTERLDSWKEIANYLGKGVRTVQRWETTDGLPVRRLNQDRTGPVFAYKAELDAWWRQKSGSLEPVAGVEKGRPQWKLVAAAIGLLVCLAAVTAVYFQHGQRPAARAVPFTSDLGSEFQPAWSPDGQVVAYVGQPPGLAGTIFLKTVSGDKTWRLTDGSGPERSPAWSPDGRTIAYFVRSSPGLPVDLMLIPATGGRPTRIAQMNAAGALAWTRDGHWLVAIEIEGQATQVRAVSVMSGESHILAPPAEFGYAGFWVSPDLARMIVTRGAPGWGAVGEIPLGPGLRPKGPERTLMRLNHGMGPITVTSDGKWIYFPDGSADEGVSLWRIRVAEGAQREMVLDTTNRSLMLALSPDERRMVIAMAPVRRHEIWRLMLGEKPVRAERLPLSTHSDLNPDYSPDGKHIAFHSTRSGASDIWVSDRDGRNARRLTFTNARTTATPRWSPDGERIAYESNESGQTEVYVIRAAGGPALRLTNAGSTDAIPAWSRDGKWVYFSSDRTGRFELWRVPAAGGEAEQVTREGGFAAVASPDGQYLYYTQTRNSGPLLRMELGTGGVETVVPEVRGLFYALTESGVYFHKSRQVIWFWDARTKEVREVFRTGRALGLGMAAAPDGKEVLFTQLEEQESDLMMVENPR